MDVAAAMSLTELRKDIRPINNDFRLPDDNNNNVNTTAITSDLESSTDTYNNTSTTTNPSKDKGANNKTKMITSSADAPGSVLNPAPFFYYIDRSDEIDDDPLTPLTPPGRVPNFPATMYAILCDPALKDVIAWMPHGRSWRILNPRELEIRVLPKYFEHNKFSSFIRQTNGWGFRRLTKGPDRHSYYNDIFLRNLPHLCKKMKRVGSASASASKITLDPLYEPNLYEISKLHPLPTSIDSFVDESINFQVSRVGPRTRRMPVTYGAFDATKPANARRVINPNIERLFKRKHVDEYAPSNIKLTDDSVSNNVTYNVTEHKQLKLVTTGQTTEANNANGNDMLQQSSSSSSLTNNNNSASHILSTSLREISTLHLEAAYRAQILSELYNSNFVPSSIRHQQIAMAASHTNNRSTSNINDLYNIYQPVVNPLSTCNASTVSSTELQEQLRNILEKNKTSSRP